MSVGVCATVTELSPKEMWSLLALSVLRCLWDRVAGARSWSAGEPWLL